MRTPLILAVALVLATAPAAAQQKPPAPPAAPQPAVPSPYAGENLLVKMPDGYKVGFSTQKDSLTLVQMVPQAESVQGWTEMVTVQIFAGMKADPAAFKTSVITSWGLSCAGASAHPIAEKTENGYRALVWMLTCPRNAKSGKPEWTWFKSIAGNDSFYVVQKAFRFEPSKEQVTRWTTYLSDVMVCDNRTKERRCKK